MLSFSIFSWDAVVFAVYTHIMIFSLWSVESWYCCCCFICRSLTLGIIYLRFSLHRWTAIITLHRWYSKHKVVNISANFYSIKSWNGPNEILRVLKRETESWKKTISQKSFVRFPLKCTLIEKNLAISHNKCKRFPR